MKVPIERTVTALPLGAVSHAMLRLLLRIGDLGPHLGTRLDRMEHLRFAARFEMAAQGPAQPCAVPCRLLGHLLGIELLQLPGIIPQQTLEYEQGSGLTRDRRLPPLDIPGGMPAQRLAHAARTPLVTGTTPDLLVDRRHNLMHALIGLLRIAQPMREALIDKDRLPSRIDAADRMGEIQRVTGHEERQQHARRVADAPQAAVGVKPRGADLVQDRLVRHQPECHRIQRHGRQVQSVHRNGVQRVEVDLLEGMRIEIGRHLAPVEMPLTERLVAELVIDMVDVGPTQRLGVVVHLDGPHHRHVALQVQRRHDEGLAQMHVDRLGVQQRRRIVAIHLPHHLATLLVVDQHIGSRRIPQRYIMLRGFVHRIIPATIVTTHLVVGGQHIDRQPRVASERRHIRIRQRQLMGRAAQMCPHSEGILRIDHRPLDAAVEDVFRMRHDVLVDGRIHPHQKDDSIAIAPPRPSRLLKEGGPRARVAHDDTRLQRPHVDTQLQRPRRTHPQQLPRKQPPLQLPPLTGKVATAVGRHLASLLRSDIAQLVAYIAVDHLRRHLRLRERDGGYAIRDQPRHQLMRLHIGAPPRTPMARTNPRRIPEDRHPPPARTPILIDNRALTLRHRPIVHRRVGQRRRAGGDTGASPVVAADAHEPPQEQRHIGPQYPAIDMKLVDDDGIQLGQKATPATVGGHDTRMQHVGIGENKPPAIAQATPHRRGRIAIIDPRQHLAEAGAREQLGEMAELILAKRLRGIDQQAARLRILQQRLQ